MNTTLAIENVDKRIAEWTDKKEALNEMSQQIWQKPIFIDQRIANLFAQLIILPVTATSWIVIQTLSFGSAVAKSTTGRGNFFTPASSIRMTNYVFDGLISIMQGVVKVVNSLTQQGSLPLVNTVFFSVLVCWKATRVALLHLFSRLHSFVILGLKWRKQQLYKKLSEENS